MSSEPPAQPLDYRQIFYLWLPLALSRMMMNVASPIANAGIARLPDPTINLAAYGLVHDMAVLIESPIIMILSASVALAQGRASYLLLRRFVFHISIFLVTFSVLVAFTPLYDVIFSRLLGAPPAVAAAARPAMQVMLLWPPAVGWRRFYQGILIRHGYSKLITYGTIWRLLVLSGTIFAGTLLGFASGAVVGALALVTSVLVEMVIILWWTLPVVRERVLPLDGTTQEEPLSYWTLVRFYLPLAGTEFMRVLSRPLTAAGVARVALPTLSLAAWPVAFSLAGLMSSAVMSIQEVVIARMVDEASRRKLVRFAWCIGIIFSTLLSIILFTPLAHLYFHHVLSVPREVEAIALPAARVLIVLPLIFAVRDFLRGVLIYRRRSNFVQTAMGVNLLTLILLLGIGIMLGGLTGAMLAAIATLGAYCLEVLLLRRSVSRDGHL